MPPLYSAPSPQTLYNQFLPVTQEQKLGLFLHPQISLGQIKSVGDESLMRPSQILEPQEPSVIELTQSPAPRLSRWPW